MKALAGWLAGAALVPVAMIALWALGWQHWTSSIPAVLIAGFIVVTALGQPRSGGEVEIAPDGPPTPQPQATPDVPKPLTPGPTAT